MILYNIHTHKISDEGHSNYKVRYILNTTPNEFSDRMQADNIWYSCGIHPWDAGEKEIPSLLETLSHIATDDRVVGIGEVGLDKIKGPDLGTQIEVFKLQIELAISLNKPLIIHCVKAWDQLINLYKHYQSHIPWIIHGFRGNSEQAKQLNHIGLKFSLGEKFNSEALKEIPLTSIFCETDQSDMSICNIYELISGYKGGEFDQFVKYVNGNIYEYFKNVTK